MHLTHIHDRSVSCRWTDIDTPNTYYMCQVYRCLCKDRTMRSHIYVLGVSMSVQRQDNDRWYICVRCIDVSNTYTSPIIVLSLYRHRYTYHIYITDHFPVFAQKSIHLTHIHDRSLSCLCINIDTQGNERWCICVRCIDVCAKTGQWAVMYMC
jgi:hypothetical protein